MRLYRFFIYVILFKIVINTYLYTFYSKIQWRSEK